jgi:adenylate kinase
MAPLGEQLVDQLRGTVDKLEARVAELEARLHGKAQSSSSSSLSPSDEMRIILMGPPGAGMRDFIHLVCFVPRLTRD